MSSGTFDTITMVDAALSSFVIAIKVLKVVVEIDTACAEVTTEEGSMSSEDGCDIDMTFPAEGDSEACLPFVEMGDNGLVESPRDVLGMGRERDCEMKEEMKRWMTYLAQEPSDDVAEDDGFVCFVIIWGCGDACEVPEVPFPLVEANVLAAGIEQEDVGVSLNKPSAVKGFHACGSEGVESACKVWVRGFLSLYLHGSRFVAEGADETVPIAVF